MNHEIGVAHGDRSDLFPITHVLDDDGVAVPVRVPFHARPAYHPDPSVPLGVRRTMRVVGDAWDRFDAALWGVEGGHRVRLAIGIIVFGLVAANVIAQFAHTAAR